MKSLEKAKVILEQLEEKQKFLEVLTECDKFLKLNFDEKSRNEIKRIKAKAFMKIGNYKAAKSLLYQFFSSGLFLDYCKPLIMMCIIEDYLKNFYLNLVEEFLQSNDDNSYKEDAIKKLLKLKPEEPYFIYEEYLLLKELGKKQETNISRFHFNSKLGQFPKEISIQ